MAELRWPRCRHRSSLNADWRCGRRSYFGRCVEHHLSRLDFHWATPWSSLRVDLSNLNRPLFQLDEERPRKWMAVSWGNSYGDPVWSLQLNRKGQG